MSSASTLCTSRAWAIGSTSSVFAYVGGSPVITVVTGLAVLAYMPAAIALLAGDRPLEAAMPWRVVALGLRMEQEYIIAILLIAFLAFVCGLVYAATGPLAMIGDVLTALVAAIAMPACAFILGRLRARNSHRF